MADMIDKAEALAPCPFCGGEARTYRYNGTTQATCVGNYKDCAGTDVSAPVAMWNRRAALPARGVGVKPPPLHVTSSMSTSTAPPQDGWHLSFGKGGFPSVMHVSGGTAFCYHDLIEGLQAWASASLALTTEAPK